jgi:hypothetical protein
MVGTLVLFSGCEPNGPPDGPGAEGYALAIGLNKVDPDHYGGWDGQLYGCEPDADDMQGIAASQGLNAEKLLTQHATRDAVLNKLGDLAEELKSGDLLVVSYSGHGGYLPDQNGDETDGKDETWCLYDGQLLDDELYGAWMKFGPGVRILVFSDSCHSGTVIKRKDLENPTPDRIKELDEKWKNIRVPLKMDRLKLISLPEMRKAIKERASLREAIGAVPASARTPIDSTVTTPPPPEIEEERVFVSRAMPFGASIQTYQKNKTFYDDLGKAAPREDSKQVEASVILISGCQDNQYSSDLGFNGLFTWALKEVWDGGSFSGDHHKFHEDIRARVGQENPEQVPNFFAVPEENPAFSQQKPYTVD